MYSRIMNHLLSCRMQPSASMQFDDAEASGVQHWQTLALCILLIWLDCAQVKDIKQQAQRALREAARELKEAEASTGQARLQVSLDKTECSIANLLKSA